MVLSQRNMDTIIAHNRGYRVCEDGSVTTPKCTLLKVSVLTSKKDDYKLHVFNMWLAKGSDPSRKRCTIRVHKLAAYQKYGDAAFMPNVHIRHKNGNSLDNSLSNIVLGTPSDNSMDRLPEDRKVQALRAARAQRKLSDCEIDDIRLKKANGSTLNQLRLEYGVAKSTLSYIVNKRTYIVRTSDIN